MEDGGAANPESRKVGPAANNTTTRAGKAGSGPGVGYGYVFWFVDKPEAGTSPLTPACHCRCLSPSLKTPASFFRSPLFLCASLSSLSLSLDLSPSVEKGRRRALARNEHAVVGVGRPSPGESTAAGSRDAGGAPPMPALRLHQHQPRHFCKACRRYWTKGGALRNIPVGGGTRKSAKRSRTATVTGSASAASSCDGASSAASHLSLPSVPVSDVGDVPAQGGPTLDINFSGSFSSLLSSSGGAPAFLALGGEPFFGRAGGYGLGLGPGLEEVGFGLGRSAWASPEMVEAGGANAWQMSSGGGDAGGAFADSGDCFAWPDLAISAPGKGLQ
ncbi:hypothetical protein H6P81_020928 [Aristolochia fimbriata]|uniref:Dof zinc finger protein n=1 Tax=Aristolochia fimbriata TaxID=158543 RepID=A0AAV7E023_ARIFI|nr:hypothetical protein H6P81_020928 [Aristolochia fimbriata]